MPASRPAQPFISTVQPTNPNPNPVSVPLIPTFVAIPGSKRWEQRKIGVRSSGVIVLAVNTTVTLALYAGISLTVGNNTLLASTGAIALTSAAVATSFFLEFDGIFDSISGNLGGIQRAQVGNVPVAAAALANVLPGLNSINEPVFQVSLWATFSVANAGSYAAVQDFGMEG